MIKTYPYKHWRAFEHPGNLDPITAKQIKYIQDLAHSNNDYNAIMQSMDETDLSKLNKGQATYVIKCLLGEIKPFIQTEGAIQIPIYCSCGCDHILRSEVIDGKYLIEYGKCLCKPGTLHQFCSKSKIN